MDKLWDKIVEILLPGTDTGTRLLVLAAVLAAGYVLRWLVERHTLEYQHRQKINETLTEKLHEYSVSHYAPTLNLVQRLAFSLESLASNPEPQKGQSPPSPPPATSSRFLQPFGQILTILAKNRQSSVIFLRSLRGEEVVGFVLNRFTRTVASQQCLTRELCTSILDEHPDGEFLQRPRSQSVDDGLERFRTWASNDREAVRQLGRQLRCFRETLLFELNLAHRGWYRRKQPAELSWSELAELNSLLKELERERIKQGRRIKPVAYLARRKYLFRICGLRGLQPEKRLQKKAEDAAS